MRVVVFNTYTFDIIHFDASYKIMFMYMNIVNTRVV